MRYVAMGTASVLAFVCGCAPAGTKDVGSRGTAYSTDEWRRPFPGIESTASEPTRTPIPEADFCEVVASKQSVAVDRLESKEIVALSADFAKYFSGVRCAPVPSKAAYLVRALYGHGGTGKFVVYRRGDDLLILHGSLGSSIVYHKSALVVHLDFEPKRIYIDVEIAK